MENRNGRGKRREYFTQESIGITILFFCGLVVVILLTGDTVFSSVGRAICTFLYGTFGYGSYLIMGLFAYLGAWLTFNKKIKMKFKTALVISLTVFTVFLLFHAVSSRDLTLSNYGAYIKACYVNASKGYIGYTCGGVISAIFVYPVAKLTTFVGSYVIFSLLTLLCGYLLYLVFKKNPVTLVSGKPRHVYDESKKIRCKKEDFSCKVNAENSKTLDEYYAEGENAGNQPVTVLPQPSRTEVYEQPVNDADKFSKENLGHKILFQNGEFAAESYKRNMIFNENSYFNRPVQAENDYLSNFSSGKKSAAETQATYSESFQEEVLNQSAVQMPSNYVYGEKPVEHIDDYETTESDVYSVHESTDVSDEYKYNEAEYADALRETVEEPVPVEPVESQPENVYGNLKSQVSEPTVTETLTQQEIAPVVERNVEEPESRSSVLDYFRQPDNDEPDEEEKGGENSISMYNLFGSSSIPQDENRIEPDVTRLGSGRPLRSNANLFDYEDDDEEEEVQPERTLETPRVRAVEERKPEVQVKQIDPPVKQTEAVQEEKPKHVWKKYVHPTLDLLDDYPEHNNVNTGEIEDNKRTIVETLARFKINSEVSNVTIGPAITRYDVIIEDKTKIKQSLNYKEAVAMALMKENVTAYLNYSKGALSIEIPNNVRTVVGLKTMLTSQKFINSKANSITFALGKTVEGEVMCPDITKMPHLLVAGTTGSGKSICLSALLVSLLYKYGPEELRFILVDPKQVEFISYDKLPHLMINEIIYEVDKAIKALNWAIKEMERRYGLFKEMTEQGKATKNLDEYNTHLAEGEEKLPKIVIILDEFGDLMLQAKKDIEGRIIKLVQKARACGIHLILATQRPSVDCITGLIKSNLPTRIGFKVNSFDDARTIFDIGGAEKLLGKGDLYFRSAESPDLARIQGCFVDTHEVQKVTDFVKAHNETYFDQNVSDFINKVDEEAAPSGGEDGSSEPAEIKIDETYIKALYYCVSSNQASVSMIQRRFPVGYIKACKIIDWMENMDYVTKSEGSKPRKVLLSKEEFLNMYGDVDD